MTGYFNLSRYKELVEQEKNGEISFLDLELLRFTSSVAEQVSYNRKKDYFILIEKYLNRIISLHDFHSKFLQMEEEDSKKAGIILEDYQKLEVFTFAKDLKQFSDLIDDISKDCSGYYETWDENPNPMSEREFYDLVNNYYLRFKNFK